MWLIFLHLYVGDKGDKYQVCLWAFKRLDCGHFCSWNRHLRKLILRLQNTVVVGVIRLLDIFLLFFAILMVSTVASCHEWWMQYFTWNEYHQHWKQVRGSKGLERHTLNVDRSADTFQQVVSEEKPKEQHFHNHRHPEQPGVVQKGKNIDRSLDHQTDDPKGEKRSCVQRYFPS